MPTQVLPKLIPSIATLLLMFAAVLLSPAGHTAGGGLPSPPPCFPLRTVFWFSNYDPTRTVWTGAQIYHGANTTIRTATQLWQGKTITGLPIESVAGTRALVFDTTNPGYWNVIFLIGSGNPANLLRIGPKPILHLRLRWGTILPDHADDLTITTGKATLPLSAYVRPVFDRWEDVNIPMTDFQKKDSSIDLTHVNAFKIEAPGNYTQESIIYLAEMAMIPTPDPKALREGLIKVDQSGWRPRDPKRALLSFPAGLVTGKVPARFAVRNIATHQIVFQGKLVQQVGAPDWNESGDTVYSADFDQVTTSGKYQVEVPGLQIGEDRFTAVSPVFPINEQVYTKDFRDALRYYYYERGGYPIVAPYGEGYTRPAKYPNTAAIHYHYPAATGNYHYTQPTRNVLGGWCDAGDPSLQVGDHAVATWWLLEMMKPFSGKVPGNSLHLPESGSKVSDLAPLVNFGLHWMTKMCNPDGSVLNSAAYENGQTEELTDIDSPTAAWTVAAFAKAYSVLKNVPGYKADATRYLTLAKRSWAWLQKHPHHVTAVTSGNPVDPHYDAQCRAFAAIEMFNATGDAAYNRVFLTPFLASGSSVLTAFGDIHTGYVPDHVMAYLNGPLEFAYLDYVDSPQATANKTAQAKIKAAFLNQAAVAAGDHARMGYLQKNPYRFTMLYPGHLYWGSNSNVLSVLGVVLLRAYQWTGEGRYREAALDNLHFIHGRNPVDRHFVSGEAADYLHGTDFYSQLWLDLKHQPPGVQGAFISVDSQLNPYIEAPWKRFINYQEASSEEPDISWNCEYAYLVGYFATDLSRNPRETR